MEWLVFLLISIAATASPGPAVINAFYLGATFGFRRAFVGILGNASAILVLALLSILGIGALLEASAIAFNVLKMFGAVYLIFIGLKMFFSKASFTAKSENQVQQTKSMIKLFNRSFFIGLSNPKALIFFTALFPQFISTSNFVWLEFASLLAIFVACSVSALSFYAWSSQRLTNLIQSSRVDRWLKRVFGSCTMGFGAALLVKD